MTTAAETKLSEKEQKKAEREADKAKREEMDAREAKLNADRTGKGTRLFLGLTRGRNPQEIQFENWDESKPETLPTTLSEFMELRKGVADSEPAIMRRLILGDNETLYDEASDPVREFVDMTWPEEVQKAFKQVIRGYSNNAGVSIEDAVTLIKPGFVAGLEKQGKLAKASETVSA